MGRIQARVRPAGGSAGNAVVMDGAKSLGRAVLGAVVDTVAPAESGTPPPAPEPPPARREESGSPGGGGRMSGLFRKAGGFLSLGSVFGVGGFLMSNLAPLLCVGLLGTSLFLGWKVVSLSIRNTALAADAARWAQAEESLGRMREDMAELRRRKRLSDERLARWKEEDRLRAGAERAEAGRERVERSEEAERRAAEDLEIKAREDLDRRERTRLRLLAAVRHDEARLARLTRDLAAFASELLDLCRMDSVDCVLEVEYGR